LLHPVSIPIDNTSVNPARSIGVAVIAGGESLVQLWAFIVFPLLGAAAGALAWSLVDEPRGDEATAAAGLSDGTSV
jgi:aquaporin Z